MSKTDLMKKVLDSISANATPKKTGSRTWYLSKDTAGLLRSFQCYQYNCSHVTHEVIFFQKLKDLNVIL